MVIAEAARIQKTRSRSIPINSEIRRLRPDFNKIVESTVFGKIFVRTRAKTIIAFFFTYPPFKVKKNQLPMTWLNDLVSLKESAWGSFGGGYVVYRAINHIFRPAS